MKNKEGGGMKRGEKKTRTGEDRRSKEIGGCKESRGETKRGNEKQEN